METFKMVEQNRDTTAWGGVAVALALIGADDLEKQLLIVVVFPTLGWLLLYFVKKLITSIEDLFNSWLEARKAEEVISKETKELHEKSESIFVRVYGYLRGRFGSGPAKAGRVEDHSSSEKGLPGGE